MIRYKKIFSCLAMDKMARLFIFFIPVLILISCETELKISTKDFPPMLVLNGVVEQDSVFVINVSRTGSLNENYSIGDLFLTDATVLLYKDDNYIEIMQHDSIGFYSSIATAEGGHTYFIKVERDGYPVARANLDFTKQPEFVLADIRIEKNDSIYAYDIPEPGGEINLTTVLVYYTLQIDDNPGEKNFYSFESFTKTQEMSYWGHMDSDEEDAVLSDLVYGQAGVMLELESDWEKYANYKTYYRAYNYSTNGFSAYNDVLFNGQVSDFQFVTYFQTTDLVPLTIIVKSYPESLIKYYESSDLYSNVFDNPFTEPVNVYSNIENGIGFVCGVVCSKVVVEVR